LDSTELGQEHLFVIDETHDRVELLSTRLLVEGVPIHQQRRGDGAWRVVEHEKDRISFLSEAVLTDGASYVVETSLGRRFELSEVEWSGVAKTGSRYAANAEHDVWRRPRR